MILGPKKLLELVKTKKLIEGLSERELTNPEGAGFDLRLGEVYRITGEAFLGVDERKTPEATMVAQCKQPSATQDDRRISRKANLPAVLIKPGEFYLVKTIEKVNMPENLTASITPRSTTYRSGLFIRVGNVPPGYQGELTFGFKNEGPVPVTMEMGARIVHIQFHEVKGGGSMYRGQWQGGRVTTKRRERQV